MGGLWCDLMKKRREMTVDRRTFVVVKNKGADLQDRKYA